MYTYNVNTLHAYMKVHSLAQQIKRREKTSVRDLGAKSQDKKKPFKSPRTTRAIVHFPLTNYGSRARLQLRQKSVSPRNNFLSRAPITRKICTCAIHQISRYSLSRPAAPRTRSRPRISSAHNTHGHVRASPARARVLDTRRVMTLNALAAAAGAHSGARACSCETSAPLADPIDGRDALLKNLQPLFPALELRFPLPAPAPGELARPSSLCRAPPRPVFCSLVCRFSQLSSGGRAGEPCI